MKSKMMRFAKMLIFSAVLSAEMQAAQRYGNESAEATNPGYTITLTEPIASFNLASPIKIPMTITNITDGEIFWPAIRSTDRDAWYSGFTFLLKKDGKEVETTYFHRKISGRQTPDDPPEVESKSTVLIPKPPGIMFIVTIDLKHLYKIKKPGTYTLEASHIGPDYKSIVHSNTVTINVVP